MAKKAVTSSTSSNGTIESLGKLQLKVVTDAHAVLLRLEEIPEIVNTLKQQVSDIEENFAFSIKEKEIEVEEKKSQLDENLKGYKEIVDLRKSELDAELLSKKTDFSRTIEGLTYAHSLEVRNLDLNAANDIANRYNKVIVDESIWNGKKEIERLNENEKFEISKIAAKEAESKVYAAKGSEMSELKHKSELEISLLKKDVETLTREIAQLRSEKEAMQKTITEQNSNMVKIAEAATRPANSGNETVNGKR